MRLRNWLEISSLKTVSAVVLALFFIVAGANHFWHPKWYERIVPPSLPSPALLVQISGAAEIAGGVGVLVPALRLYAGIGLVLLLIAVFPANVYMAQHAQAFSRVASPALLWIRLPLQAALIAWVWWTCA